MWVGAAEVSCSVLVRTKDSCCYRRNHSSLNARLDLCSECLAERCQGSFPSILGGRVGVLGPALPTRLS